MCGLMLDWLGITLRHCPAPPSKLLSAHNQYCLTQPLVLSLYDVIPPFRVLFRLVGDIL